MISHLRSFVLATVLAGASCFTPSSQAQDSASLQEEVRALRQMVELQSKQLQALTDQVARLALQLGDRTPAPAAVAAPAAEAPGAAPVARVVAPPPPPSNVHIIVKGDSLDKIAKQHNVTVADLLKLNKITDPKKLQIGQQIILPPNVGATAPPAPATPATPGVPAAPATPGTPEKKEGQ